MPQPTRRRMDPALRREQILDAAIRLIGQLGYQGFTVQKLAQACELTNGGLLHYFGSKELLLVAILEERDRREAAIIPVELAAQPATASEAEYSRAAALRVFHAIVARSVAQPELLRLLVVLQAEALNRDHPAHAYFLRREAMVLAEFANVLAGEVGVPRNVARRILAVMTGLEQQWLRADQGFDLIAECDAAIAALLDQAASGDRHDL
ncbi:TetR/AcrR family transcriptional regulator [Caulobacter soli]|uniref:TetR/AcrR family transcriptional regulator n=1 Tax=Caulobacter soli TaxID=2708539 RepID=UPI0013EBB871|nr:TetR/AcrR family transcriptional regulator [Caulobacter soli]